MPDVRNALLVAQIEYRELTADGFVRHATFKGAWRQGGNGHSSAEDEQLTLGLVLTPVDGTRGSDSA